MQYHKRWLSPSAYPCAFREWWGRWRWWRRRLELQFPPPPSPPTVVSSTSALSLLDQLLALVKMIRSLSLQMLKLENHNRNLTVGSKGKDVWALQVFLVVNNILNPTGPSTLKLNGPTSYFDLLTKAALAEYQQSAGVFPAAGFFGPKTRALMFSLGGEAATSLPSTPLPPSPSSAPPFTKDLSYGMTDPEVATLQKFLAPQDPNIYPEGRVSGYYGEATERAVKTFQILEGVALPGDANLGTVDRATRAKLNAFYVSGKTP
jgi:peptidoglycan hydrolase-like protein with peptidoglycan-binding domain